MRNLFLLLFLFILSITLAILLTNNQFSRGLVAEKKVIEWGWGTPFPNYVKEHIQEMETISFDGLVLDNPVNRGQRSFNNRLGWNIWSPEKIRIENYSDSVQALQSINFRRFTDNFLRLNMTPGNVDWYDQDFQSVIQNATLIAKIAKSSGCIGILLDNETYSGKVFHYPSQKYNQQKSFIDYQQEVRRRGKEFIQAINSVYPDIKILVTLGYSTVVWHKQWYKLPLEKQTYGLMPSFLDGILESATSDTLVYDGYEFSYGYKSERAFQKSYQQIYEQSRQVSQVNDQDFRQHYRASFSIWLDYNIRGHQWNQEDVKKNYFTPEQFESSLRYALKYTDRYVWIYSQKANWWDSQVPHPYIDALNKARNP